MLQKIRDNTQGTLSKIFIILIIAVFALFGVDAIVGTIVNTTTVTSVNGVDIDEYTVDYETQIKTQELLNTLGPDADLSGFDDALIREAALNELIQRELLFQSASNAGMTISSASIDRAIAQTPDFQVDGVFNNERAQLLLQNLGYTPSSYRITLQREGLLNQLLSAYQASGFSTPAELEMLASLSNQKRNLRYLLLNLDIQNEGMEISEEDLRTYYEANQDEFIQPEQVAIEYIELDKEAMLSSIEISEEQIRNQYNIELQAYQSQIERRASHILFEAFSAADYATALAEAEQVKARLDAGEDFADLAAEFSDDLGSAEDGGDVGYTNGDNFVEEFETALQNLEVDEVSGPVRTEFGYHLIKLTDRSETEVETFEQRRDAIERDLQLIEANTMYLSQAEELSNLAFESLDLNEPAEIMGLELQQSELFDREGGVGITAFDGVVAAAFSLEVLEDGLNSDLIQLDENRSVVIRVSEHNLPDVMAFEQVRGLIEVQLRYERAREQAQLIGETIVSTVTNGQNIDGLLAAQNLSWNQLNELERTDNNINPEIIDLIFTMEKPTDDTPNIQGFQLSSGEYIVVELQEVIPGTIADFEDNEEQSFRDFISQQTAANDFASFMTGLEEKATIITAD